MNNNEQVWFITGCSTGFGKALAIAVLERGYKAVVTARKMSDLDEVLAQFPTQVKGLILDMENHAQIVSAAAEAIAAFGRVDVLVNNAGIGYFSSAEEADMQIVRKMFEVNFFGLTELTSLILPQMRKQKSGHVMNVSSIGGLKLDRLKLETLNVVKDAISYIRQRYGDERAEKVEKDIKESKDRIATQPALRLRWCCASGLYLC